ncbi:MAG: hypothetical protein H7318_07115 [Oligoflexus sp.]|nr:hypothetical protein [Oligoflexus sp.]
MIGKSNDSFVAFKNLELKNISKGQSVKVRATNYDAGTEENTGNVEDLNATNHPTFQDNYSSGTTAHEICHQLGLAHRQDNNNPLAIGKTGWTLNAEEVATIRSNAVKKFGAQYLPKIEVDS